MHIRGWVAEDYNGDELIFRDFPEGRWELVGFLRAVRNPLRSDSWLIECAFRNCANAGLKAVARADVGCLPFLLPGLKFESGKIIGDNLYANNITRETLPLAIEPDSLIDFDIYGKEEFSHVDALGNETLVKHNIVPFKVMQFAGLDKSRYRLIGVRQKGDPYAIIIPASVLAHFYFAGISRRLAQALFSGRLNDVVDLRHCEFLDEDHRHFSMMPRANVSVGDCWMLARVLATPSGSPERRAFFRIHNSLVRARVNGQPMLPKALFPFVGQTQLSVLGTSFPVWDGNGNNIGKRFFVRRILSCTADWPIDRLTIRRDHLMTVGDDKESPENTITVRATERADQIKMTWERRPNNSMTSLVITLGEVSDRFPALLKKTTSHDTRSHEHKNDFGVIFTDGGFVEEGSTLPGSDPNSNVVPVDFVSDDQKISQTQIDPETQTEIEEKPKRLVAERSTGTESFLIVLELLQQWGVAVQSIAVSDKTYELEGWEFGVFPPLENGKGWEMLDKSRPTGQEERLALAAELKFRDAAGAIYFIEPRDKETTGCIMLALAPTGRSFPFSAHEEILDGVRSLRRVWGNGSTAKDVEKVVDDLFYGRILDFQRIEHRHKEASPYAEIILGHLKRVASKQAEDSQTGEQ